MNDERLRALERRWEETGSAEDEEAWDLERSRQGLPLRVSVVSIRVRIFEPHLEEESVRRGHRGLEEWEDLIEYVLRRPKAPWLVVDMSPATYFHDVLAGALLGGLFRLRDAGGGFVVCGLRSSIRIVFDRLGLGELIPFSDSVATCLQERGWEARGPATSIEHLAEI